MTQFGTITIGRFPLVEFPTKAATDASAVGGGNTPTGRTLKISGQESVPSATEIATTSAQLEAWRSDMNGLVNSFVSVVFTDKTGLNGYYMVTDASADVQNWEGEQQTLTWTMDLVRIGTDYEVDVESRLTGGTRANSFALTGVKWHSPSIGHYAYYSATGNTPTTVARVGSDGTHIVYVNLPSSTSTIPRWGCAVTSYMSGRCQFVDDNAIERSGILFRVNNPISWTLQNGLIKVTPAGGSGVFAMATWTGAASSGSAAAFASKNWDIKFNNVSLGNPLGVSLLRNEPEMIVLRMVFTYLVTTRVTVDLTLRRGARHVEVFCQAQSSGQFKIARLVSEAASSGTGFIRALTDDSNGNMYVLGSALSFTSDLANGAISSSANVLLMDSIVGAQASQPVLNANPYLETTVGNYATSASGGTAARDSTRAHQGTWSLKLTPDGVASQVASYDSWVAVTPGQTYDATAWAWPTSAMGANSVITNINWYTPASAYISSSFGASTVTSGQWNFVTTRNAAAPATAAFGEVGVIEGGTAPASATIWFDEIKLRPSIPTGDAASDLYSQYLATPSELIQGIRR